MKRTLLKVQAMVLIGFFIVACEHSSLDDMNMAANEADAVKTIAPSPMPPDSLELDTLNKPGYR